MSTWHFYRLSDGIFTGRALTAPSLAALQANTPEGCGALLGVSDWQSQRVDLATGLLVDWQPPAPADDELRTWRWDDSARRWVPVPTAAAVGQQMRQERDRRLASCDWVMLRAIDSGLPVPADWAAYRAALRAVPAQPGFPYQIDWPQAPA